MADLGPGKPELSKAMKCSWTAIEQQVHASGMDVKCRTDLAGVRGRGTGSNNG